MKAKSLNWFRSGLRVQHERLSEQTSDRVWHAATSFAELVSDTGPWKALRHSRNIRAMGILALKTHFSLYKAPQMASLFLIKVFPYSNLINPSVFDLTHEYLTCISFHVMVYNIYCRVISLFCDIINLRSRTKSLPVEKPVAKPRSSRVLRVQHRLCLQRLLVTSL